MKLSMAERFTGCGFLKLFLPRVVRKPVTQIAQSGKKELQRSWPRNTVRPSRFYRKRDTAAGYLPMAVPLFDHHEPRTRFAMGSGRIAEARARCDSSRLASSSRSLPSSCCRSACRRDSTAAIVSAPTTSPDGECTAAATPHEPLTTRPSLTEKPRSRVRATSRRKKLVKKLG